MGSVLVGRKRLFATGALCALAGIGAATAEGATTRSCRPVVNPYEGSRFDGVDLRRIRATGVSCRTARRVVRGAHYRALELPPPGSGVRRFSWRGWRVTGDLRGPDDVYVARRDRKRVRWIF